jgi:adenosylcobinamide-GDP ribazoletransferase
MRAFLVALAFLTRLPVRVGAAEPAEVGRSVAFFPLVGGVLGALLAGAQLGLGAVLPPSLLALVLVALWAALTGGLHLDGVADLFDGLGGGRGDPERILALMRDSRIGAHGATALVLVLLGKVLALGELLQHGMAWPLLGAPVVARFAVVPMLAFSRYARDEGLGKAFHEHARKRELVLATMLALACIAALGPRAVLPALVALSIAFGLGSAVSRKLSGLTGDAYGAAIELAELGFLLACAA